ncbi:hypothetical protein FPHYL_13462 [Fusarium phyllophilum]|uniref:BTB domain-containing protein n=1 Tax=Fusarium phyllophilum TaxID=47803 RepID=A0A8H5IBS3_9HYPO|nr:hypothetical protein FPHYL_13462 [Fusarium phyllophilum]
MSALRAKRQEVAKEKDNPTTPDFQSFAPDGDVVFVVNNDTRVRVQSTVMKSASRVFAKMLGPNFMEGQALAAANTKTDPFEIALPEEESSICFGWICRALHCQSSTTLWNPTRAEIVKVWSIIDKYDMKQSMQLSVMFWSNILSKTCPPWDLWPMALVCLQHRDATSYKTITGKLLRLKGSFLTRASETEKLVENTMLLRHVYKLAADPRQKAKLQEVRADAQRKVVELVYMELPHLIGSNNCGTETTAYFDYLIELTHRCGGIYFLGPEEPLSRIHEVLSELGNWLSLHGTVHGGSCENCTVVHGELREEISKVAPVINGLCLGCFEGDNTCPEHKKYTPELHSKE